MYYEVALTHLSLDKNGRHFADDIFKRIFINEKFYFSIQISPKFVPEDSIDSIGSGNGLAPNRGQVIIWTYATQFTDTYMRY